MQKPKEKSELGLKGRWFIELHGPDGVLKDYREGENVVCTNGKEKLAEFMAAAANAATTLTFKYIGVGSDATAEAAANTALGTELARHTGIVSYVSNQIYQVKATFASGLGTGSIVEFGLFNSATGGTMLNRDTEAAVNKGASDQLTVTMQLTLS